MSLRGEYESSVALYAMQGTDGLVSSSQLLCQWYGESVQNRTEGIFNKWFAHSELAANTMGSFIQDLLVPAGGVEQCLSGALSKNPYAVVLMPTPHDHFHVCGRTSACQLRCAVELAAFQVCRSSAVAQPQLS